MSFHSGFTKKTPSRANNDSLKRKSSDLQDSENRSPNIKESKAEAENAKKIRITRSASNLQQPRRGSKLAPPTRSSSSSKLPTKTTAEPKKRTAGDKTLNERHVKTPSKTYDRTSLLSPHRINSSSKKVLTPPSSVLKFPRQCLKEKIKGFFDKAPIKSVEEINLLINPKLKPTTKWVDFREKAKRQNEVIGDLKGVLKETLTEYKHVQENCVGAERTMEEQYQKIRNSLKEQLQINLDLKTNEAQLQSEFAKIFGDYTAQSLEVQGLQRAQEELSTKNDEFSKMVSELADKLKTETEVRIQIEALLETTKHGLSVATEEKVTMLKNLKESNEKVCTFSMTSS
jgi:hypothetical protein